MDGSRWIEHLLTGLPGGPVGFLIFVNIFIFVLAFFLDFFEIAFIVIPMLAPVAQSLGIDLIWFGVLICINMQTSFMHPPFGFALFYLRSIAPREVKTTDIYMGALPWLAMQLILVAVVIFWPESVTHWLDNGPKIDPSTINIVVPGFGENGGGAQMPNFGLPPLGDDGKGGLPGLGSRPAEGVPGQQPATAQPAKPAVDLSQPPVIQ